MLSRLAGRATSAAVALGAMVGFSGCGAPEVVETDEAVELGKSEAAITGGWTTLSLRHGWKAASNSNVPAVGIVNGIVTFRGALDGTAATSSTAFCLPSSTFHPTDAGYITLRAALANGVSGSLVLDFPVSQQIPPADRYCISVQEHGASSQPGPAARTRTSLEGVSFDKSVVGSYYLDRTPDWEAFSAYPSRGSDANAHPEGQGVSAKLVNGFVRLQGVLAAAQDSPLTLLTLPANAGMIPGNSVYLPVTLCPLFGALAGGLVVQPNGQVVAEGSAEAAWCGVSLDGVSFSMASQNGSSEIGLSNGWVAHSARAVRARVDGEVVRLQGAVKSGTTTVIGTLPAGLRPAAAVTVTALAIQFAQPAAVRISTSGTITIVSPSLVAAQPGLSLDGVSFGL